MSDVTALTVPQGDAAALRHAINFLMTNPAEREALSARAKAEVAHYGRPQYFEAVEHMLKKIGQENGLPIAG